jgi:hypothetical protein
MPSKYPSIPMPASDVDALYNTCMVMKQTIEQLVAGRSTAVQGGPPASPSVGDLWIQPDGGRMSYWNGSQWVLMSGGVGGFGTMAVDGQAIPTAPTKIVLAPPFYNLGNFYNADTQRFIPPAGMVQFNMQVQAVLNGGNRIVNVGVYKNGVQQGISSASGGVSQLVTATLSFSAQELAQPDYYEMYFWASNAGMTVIGAGSGFGAWGVGTGGI